ncbi:hypothetical protein B0H34DRAFT_796394 [Crassisporium funariophilum]|nr:hypothetical protein B0H34DRAFT_796394 [Crassisporium funariophilum]
MDVLSARITRLQEEVERIRRERDRYKRIAAHAEDEIAKRRIEYLNLEEEYEEEKRKRCQIEKVLDSSDSGFREVALAASTSTLAIDNLKPKDARKPVLAEVTSVDSDTESAFQVKLDLPVKRTRASMQTAVKPKSEEVERSISPPDLKSNKKRRLTQFTTIDLIELEVSPPVQTQSSSRALLKGKFKEVVPLTLPSPHPVEREKKRKLDDVSGWSVSDEDGSVDGPDSESGLAKGKTKSLPRTTLSVLPPSTSMTSSRYPLPLDPVAIEVDERDLKVKSKSGFVLLPSRLSQCLSKTSTKVFHISPSPRALRLSRKCLSQKYGLPKMGLLWVSQNKDHRLLLPTYHLNPQMPREPGEPGLLLSCRDEFCDGVLCSRAIKDMRRGWGGTMRVNISEQLLVKNAWGDKIARHKKYPVYVGLRARITLRLRGIQKPTDEEVKKEIVLIRKKTYHSELTSGDVIKAFERGDEAIKIVKVHCVGFNHEREADLEEAEAQLNGMRMLANAASSHVNLLDGENV